MRKRLKDIKVLPKIPGSLERLPLPKKLLEFPLGAILLFVLCLANFVLAWPFLKNPASPNTFSAPVIPLLAALASWVFKTSPEMAVDWILTVFCLLGIVTFYLLVMEITRRRLLAVLATLFYSLPFQRGLPVNLGFSLVLGDGAHIASLSLTPLAILAVRRFLSRGIFPAAVWGSAAMALVALISPFGFLNLAIFLLIFAFSEMLLGSGKLKLMRLLVCFFIGFGFCAFWYNPGFLRQALVSFEGRAILSTFWSLAPPAFFIVPIVATFGFLLFERRPFFQPFFVALSLTFVFFLLSWAHGFVNLTPFLLPDRYRPELKFGVSLLFSLGAVAFLDFIRKAPKIGRVQLTSSWGQRLSLGLLVAFFTLGCLLWLSSARRIYSEAILSEVRHQSVEPSRSFGGSKIWEKTGTLSTGLGFAISALTVSSLFFLKRTLENKARSTGFKSK